MICEIRKNYNKPPQQYDSKCNPYASIISAKHHSREYTQCNNKVNLVVVFSSQGCEKLFLLITHNYDGYGVSIYGISLCLSCFCCILVKRSMNSEAGIVRSSSFSSFFLILVNTPILINIYSSASFILSAFSATVRASIIA